LKLADRSSYFGGANSTHASMNTGPVPFETAQAPLEMIRAERRRRGISLFWRTFSSLAIVLLLCNVLWMQAMFNVLQAPSGFNPGGLVWALAAILVSLIGASIGARIVARPIRELSFAASRAGDGDFSISPLDEDSGTPEIREVNAGFNRMASQLSKIDQDRAVMLAGLSHDLRTPLARMRLETEISVADPNARAQMAADIEQIDGIIDKFMDYARPTSADLVPINVLELVSAAAFAVRNQDEVKVRTDVTADMWVKADWVDLLRVISNLIENARRYGKTPETGIALVDVSGKTKGEHLILRVRDHGTGVSSTLLANLTKPFFRGDAARTAATGAGLGLAIVEKTVQRMGGSLAIANSSSGGLAVYVRLLRSPPGSG
jgi:two-component system osmolarity sensor histidine kinase EnvZ